MTGGFRTGPQWHNQCWQRRSRPSWFSTPTPRSPDCAGKTPRTASSTWRCGTGANRDPEVFENPDVFDNGRDNSKLLMFGLGAHYCLGVHLAKAEVKAVVHAPCDVLRSGSEIRKSLREFRPVGLFERPTNFSVDFGDALVPGA